MDSSKEPQIAKWIFYPLCALLVVALMVPFLLPSIGKSEYYHSMDEALRSPTRVKKLDIEAELTEFPDGIRKLTNLQILCLRGDNNKFDKLPNWLHENSNLQQLYLGDCRFKTFPSEVTQMTNLRELGLIHCFNTELPASLSKLKSLEILELRFNDLTDIPEEFSQLKSLRVLDLEGNRLSDEVIKKVRKFLPKTHIISHDQHP